MGGPGRTSRPGARTSTARCALPRACETAVSASQPTPPSSSTTSKTALAMTAPARLSTGSSSTPRLPLMSSLSSPAGVRPPPPPPAPILLYLPINMITSMKSWCLPIEPDADQAAAYSSATFLPPSLNSDSIADTIKTFFPMDTTTASSSCQNYPPDLVSRSNQAQDLRLSLQSFQDPMFHQNQTPAASPSRTSSLAI